MNVEKINSQPRRKRILLAPLDWGLGHATRCIPLVTALREAGADVFLATAGPGVIMFQKQFPDAFVFELPGYRIRYSKRKHFLLLKVFSQLPHIISVMRREKKLLAALIKTNEIDGVISDNRPGLTSFKIPCVYITHQLQLKTGIGIFNRFAQKIHYHIINKFRECWVPDFQIPPGLAGTLSHPKTNPAVPVKYLGILSRISKSEIQVKRDLLIVLSGPEPQRTLFENKLLLELKIYAGSVTLVRGRPEDDTSCITDLPHVSVKNFAGAAEMTDLLQSSKIILARCGYSTVMDLYGINQNAILVPTPGQPEQEYLADHLKNERLFYTTTEKDFDLSAETLKLRQFQFCTQNLNRNLEMDVINEWLTSI